MVRVRKTITMVTGNSRITSEVMTINPVMTINVTMTINAAMITGAITIINGATINRKTTITRNTSKRLNIKVRHVPMITIIINVVPRPDHGIITAGRIMTGIPAVTVPGALVEDVNHLKN